jgi:hypothetical protein
VGTDLALLKMFHVFEIVFYRKRQQAVLAKKNAERSIGKTHFRSQHCLPRVG